MNNHSLSNNGIHVPSTLKCAAFLLALTLLPALLNAQGYIYRSGTWDVGVRVFQQVGFDFDTRGGTSVDINDDLGIGLGFGYNINEHLNLGFTMDYIRSKYTATVVPGDPIEPPFDIKHKMDFIDLHMNASWILLEGPLSPFARVGAGYTFIDTNVADGPPQVGCWWDPWWGYICQGYQRTYSAWRFSYLAEIGLRWEVADALYVSGSIQQRWIDISTAKDTPSTQKIILEVGFNY